MLRLCSVLVLLLLPNLAGADIRGIVRVIDADTIDVGGIRIRLHAIDAPEIGQSCKTEQGLPFACGAWVTGQVRAMYEGRQVTCQPRDTDRHGRTVAKCAVAGSDMGAEIVAAGLAFAYRKYGMDYDLDEKSAYVADRGLHGVRVQSPAQFRQTRANGRIPPDPACRIKGNISPNGYIFHMPGQDFYERTGINEARGERWFCSAAQARQAGWRPARR
ncbi:thermonuclease family protein [uncultured Tateyamaria sp.]|uniref:thermonuclease family protein n=1 Tax=uncultured Tateyamaria sp. TaxID=455651 RepID=UPI002627698C|nr:thermonuclease family protein [uncultured Tateyamaria sp.]